jgi:hypothetical protein
LIFIASTHHSAAGSKQKARNAGFLSVHQPPMNRKPIVALEALCKRDKDRILGDIGVRACVVQAHEVEAEPGLGATSNIHQKISFRTPVTTSSPIRKIMPTIHNKIFIFFPFHNPLDPMLGKSRGSR